MLKLNVMNNENDKKQRKRKPGGGRKTLYNKKFHPKWVKSLAIRGLTDKQISKELEISEMTLNNWKHKYSEFFEALKQGKEEPDDKVEQALFERATGYEHPEDKFFFNSKTGKVVVQPTIKHYPPDPVSMIFWLKNRRSDRWRDKQEIKHGYDEDFKKVLESIMSKKDKKIEIDEE